MIKKKVWGYTLIELLMAISLLVIILVGGTTIFYRSFRSSGVSDIQTTLNNGLRSLDEMIERTLRYGEVLRVGDSNFREECLEGEVSGSTLVVRDASGGVAIYSLLEDGRVSSNSSDSIISNSCLKITKLQFTWICRSGVNDKMNLLIEAEPVSKADEGQVATFKKDLNLLNSGIN
jgi:prepilin-type N-terminal cleavage/methylation domain-containing protein